MAKPSKIPVDFYRQDDVVALAPALLGKVLCTKLNGKFTSGIIVETEAYQGTTDKACHAYNNRRTTRTETMFQPGGVAYIYLCYGMYHLFNIVTNIQDVPDAVLVRAIEPLHGQEQMLKRRKMKRMENRLTAGPGTLSQALGITKDLDRTNLTGNKIWIEDHNITFSTNQIRQGTRVGVHYAGKHSKYLWRFSVKNNPWVSPAK